MKTTYPFGRSGGADVVVLKRGVWRPNYDIVARQERGESPTTRLKYLPKWDCDSKPKRSEICCMDIVVELSNALASVVTNSSIHLTADLPDASLMVFERYLGVIYNLAWD